MIDKICLHKFKQTVELFGNKAPVFTEERAFKHFPSAEQVILTFLCLLCVCFMFVYLLILIVCLFVCFYSVHFFHFCSKKKNNPFYRNRTFIIQTRNQIFDQVVLRIQLRIRFVRKKPRKINSGNESTVEI